VSRTAWNKESTGLTLPESRSHGIRGDPFRTDARPRGAAQPAMGYASRRPSASSNPRNRDSSESGQPGFPGPARRGFVPSPASTMGGGTFSSTALDKAKQEETSNPRFPQPRTRGFAWHLASADQGAPESPNQRRPESLQGRAGSFRKDGTPESPCPWGAGTVIRGCERRIISDKALGPEFEPLLPFST